MNIKDMNCPVYCDNCGCFTTTANVWPINQTIVCAHCFIRITNTSPYHRSTVADNDDFDQLLREIDDYRHQSCL